MNIPDFQTVMLPLMEIAKDKNEHTLRDVVKKLSDTFSLTEEEKNELLPSGTQAVFDNRVGWAKTHLLKAGLLESPRRSIFKISDRGSQIMETAPSKINVSFLKQFPEYIQFIKSTKSLESDKTIKSSEHVNELTPEESLEYSYQVMRETLATEVLDRVKSISFGAFEKLVVELLVKMGYGGSIKDAGQATKKTRDEGIDGIIKEDKLGLDTIYIQAKRWEGVVGRPEIQKFIGALAGQGAKKGIFITTSYFSPDAIGYAPGDFKIVLVDGKLLSQLMIDHNLGVASSKVFEIKKLDTDYFESQE